MKIVLHETIQLTNMLRADSVVKLVVAQSDESIITQADSTQTKLASLHHYKE